MWRTTLACFLVPAMPCMAGTISLDLPVDCTLGQSCYIQNYVDRDPGPGTRDVGCGTLSYNGHKGTDFALPTVAAMRAGVKVLAAAAGTVRAVRDGEPDRAFVDGVSVAGRECGNGIVIKDGDGWETQYCHMRDGSISVKPGQVVAAGDVLGLVGQSGKAEFPHLHLSLRHDGKTVDPFDPDMRQACATDIAAQELWAEPIAYVPTGVLQVGFASQPPSYDAVKQGLAPNTTLPADGPALVVWLYGFGAQTGDQIKTRITGPDGLSFAHDAEMKKSQALFFQFFGRKTPASGWPAGRYRAQVEILRAGPVVAHI